MNLSDVTISGGRVFYLGGAGIENGMGAEATITRALIEKNECLRISRGGGIYNQGVMWIDDTTIRDNTSVSGSNIRNEEGGHITITRSRVLNDREWSASIINDGTLVDGGGNVLDDQ
jgi:hypothetical protein